MIIYQYRHAPITEFAVQLGCTVLAPPTKKHAIVEQISSS